MIDETMKSGESRRGQGGKILTGLFTAGVLGLVPFFASSYLLTIMITALHCVYLAQSWNLIFGYTGQLALGHGVFYGIAGYLSTKLFLALHVTPYLGGVLGALVAALFAIPLGAILFRSKLKGLYLALVTFAAMEILKALFNNWKFVGGSVGIYLPFQSAPANFLFMSRLPYYFITLFMVIGMIFLTRFIERSKLGHRAIAVRENEEAAEASGIDCFDTKMKMFVLSAFFTGLAGTFYAQFMLYIVPEIMFGFPNVVLLPMLGVIVGGRGTIFGPVVGTLVFSIFSELLRRIPFLQGPQVSAATMMFYGVVLTVVSLRYYGGLMGLVDYLRKISLLGRKPD
jgi:branched-chain amino acid transport system permease protein